MLKRLNTTQYQFQKKIILNATMYTLKIENLEYETEDLKVPLQECIREALKQIIQAYMPTFTLINPLVDIS